MEMRSQETKKGHPHSVSHQVVTILYSKYPLNLDLSLHLGTNFTPAQVFITLTRTRATALILPSPSLSFLHSFIHITIINVTPLLKRH